MSKLQQLFGAEKVTSLSNEDKEKILETCKKLGFIIVAIKGKPAILDLEKAKKIIKGILKGGDVSLKDKLMACEHRFLGSYPITVKYGEYEIYIQGSIVTVLTQKLLKKWKAK